MMMMMLMHVKRRLQGRTMLCGLCSLVALTAWLCVAHTADASTLPGSLNKFNKMLHEKTAKEIRMNFKVLLTNMKVRQVPLAKARSEKLLAKLYREERLLKDQIEVLNKNLGSINDKQRRQSMRIIEVDKNPKANIGEKTASGARKNLMKVHELSQARVDQWTSELNDKTRELEELRAKIEESKNIIKHPDSYISIPSNYGRSPPEEVQDRERDVLVKDREIMDYRQKILSGEEELPAFMADHW